MTIGLSPSEAQPRLGIFGRVFYDVDAQSIWERDTKTLPWGFRRKRRLYRQFAQAEIAPAAAAADLDPHSFDTKALFVKSGLAGFQTELLPWPLGTGSYATLTYSLLMGQALRAEECCTACGGLGLALMAHELGMAPLFVSADLKAVLKWMLKIYGEIKAGEPAIAAFAITEPGAGSDVEETLGAASAKVGCRAKKVEGGWKISGRKVFISDGRVAKWVTLFAAQEGQAGRVSCSTSPCPDFPSGAPSAKWARKPRTPRSWCWRTCSCRMNGWSARPAPAGPSTGTCSTIRGRWWARLRWGSRAGRLSRRSGFARKPGWPTSP